MGLDRQQASWQILALRDRERPLWSFSATSCDIAASPAASPVASPAPDAPDIEQHLPAVAELADIAKDFDATGVTLKRHPIACIRERLDRARAVACSWLRDEARCPTGSIVLVAGLVLVRQRPSTAKGVVFMTIEDESAIANLIFRPKVYERLRTQVRRAMVVCVRGQVERRDGVVHLLVTNAKDVTKALASAQIDAVSKPRDFR
jgi:error-prone DNA polymerase